MDEVGRAIVDLLQDGLEVCERPFAAPAAALGIEEAALVERVRRLREAGTLTRFGPMYDAERLGGAVTLAAMQVPAERFDTVAAEVSAFREVAHNYEREHALNMWFVLATETPGEIPGVIDAIAARTGCTVHDMPKLEEYYIGLRLRAGEHDAPQGSESCTPRRRAHPCSVEAIAPHTSSQRQWTPSPLPRGPKAAGTTPRTQVPSFPRKRESMGLDRTPMASSVTSADPVRSPAGGGLDATDRAIVAATQAGLPLAARPYHQVAAGLGIEPSDLMRRLQRMLDTGAIRRIAAVPNHYALGYRANGMSVWDVDDAHVTEAGRAAGALPFVSHCYRRPRHPPIWPYNLFAMVHGRSRVEVQAHVDTIASVLGARQRAHDVLYSRRILKKTGLRLRRAASNKLEFRNVSAEMDSRFRGNDDDITRDPRQVRHSRDGGNPSPAPGHLESRNPRNQDRSED